MEGVGDRARRDEWSWHLPWTGRRPLLMRVRACVRTSSTECCAARSCTWIIDLAPRHLTSSPAEDIRGVLMHPYPLHVSMDSNKELSHLAIAFLNTSLRFVLTYRCVRNINCFLSSDAHRGSRLTSFSQS